MKHKISPWLCILATVLITVSFAPARDQQPEIPTTQQLEQLYFAGEYHACLQQISRLLFLKGAPASGVDRPKLLLLRGDCLVKLKDSRTALKAFKEAEQAAINDPYTALRARAGVVILQRCRGLTYMPPGITPIDVTTDTGWKEAAAQIYHSIMQSSQNELTAAENAQELAVIFQVVPKLADLFALVDVSQLDSSQLVGLAQNIGQRARDLILRDMDEQEKATAFVEKTADVVLSTTYGGGWGSPWGGYPIRQGLSTPDRDNLNHIIDRCNQAYDVAAQGQEIAYRLGGNESKWQAVIERIIQVRDHAQFVLNAE